MMKEYRMSVAEKYFASGYLDLGDPMVSALDRLSAAKRLNADFYLGGLSGRAAVDVAKIRVDGGGRTEASARMLHHRDWYEKAIAAVPAEFWPAVRKVASDDEPLAAAGGRLEIKKNLYAQRLDLCRGLDRLVKFYWHTKSRL